MAGAIPVRAADRYGGTCRLRTAMPEQTSLRTHIEAMRSLIVFMPRTFRTAVTALAVGAVALFGASAASAASTPGSAQVHVAAQHGTPASAGITGVRPAADVTCDVQAVTPFQIVNGGRTYGRGVISYCTSDPAPQECRLSVELQVQVEPLGIWSGLAASNPGWTTDCSLQVTASYKCQGIIAKRNFRSVTTLDIMYDGATDSATATSPTASLYCD